MTSQQAVFNILLTSLLIFLLAASSYLFNVDVRESVVKPIERTTRVIKKLAHTLFLLSHDDEMGDGDDNDETAELFEGQFIDNITERLNTFFNVDKPVTTAAVTPVSVFACRPGLRTLPPAPLALPDARLLLSPC